MLSVFKSMTEPIEFKYSKVHNKRYNDHEYTKRRGHQKNEELVS